MVEAYPDDPVVFIGIERGEPWSSKSDVIDWISTYGWDFLIGINDSQNEIYLNYEPKLGSTAYDTFYVIDGNGTVTLRSLRPNDTSDFPTLRAAVDAALTTVAVEPTTWGRIKRLYP